MSLPLSFGVVLVSITHGETAQSCTASVLLRRFRVLDKQSTGALQRRDVNLLLLQPQASGL